MKPGRGLGSGYAMILEYIECRAGMGNDHAKDFTQIQCRRWSEPGLREDLKSMLSAGQLLSIAYRDDFYSSDASDRISKLEKQKKT